MLVYVCVFANLSFISGVNSAKQKSPKQKTYFPIAHSEKDGCLKSQIEFDNLLDELAWFGNLIVKSPSYFFESHRCKLMDVSTKTLVSSFFARKRITNAQAIAQ